MPDDPIQIRYKIVFNNGRTTEFPIEFDPLSLKLTSPPPPPHLPDWAKLSCHQCPNCPFKEAHYPYCPAAVNLFMIIQAFSCDISYHEVKVTVWTKPRTYQQDISLQNALRSLAGLLMASSDCPHLAKLRPLIWTHLPFATTRETAYRALSMYLMAQFFIQKKGGGADWSLKSFEKMYQEIEVVNSAFHKRLLSAGISDAALNAIVNLNCYAQFSQMFLQPGSLSDLEASFIAHFPE